jgi:hypothetical protein
MSFQAKWRISVLLVPTDIKNILTANQRTSCIFMYIRIFMYIQYIHVYSVYSYIISIFMYIQNIHVYSVYSCIFSILSIFIYIQDIHVYIFMYIQYIHVYSSIFSIFMYIHIYSLYSYIFIIFMYIHIYLVYSCIFVYIQYIYVYSCIFSIFMYIRCIHVYSCMFSIFMYVQYIHVCSVYSCIFMYIRVYSVYSCIFGIFMYIHHKSHIFHSYIETKIQRKKKSPVPSKCIKNSKYVHGWLKIKILKEHIACRISTRLKTQNMICWIQKKNFTIETYIILQSGKREKNPTRCNNQMFIINFCLNMFRASLCPSSGDQRPCVTAYGALLWFCCMWLVADVGRCVVGCEQCSHPTNYSICTYRYTGYE